jgi:hypothetical protein
MPIGLFQRLIVVPIEGPQVRFVVYIAQDGFFYEIRDSFRVSFVDQAATDGPVAQQQVRPVQVDHIHPLRAQEVAEGHFQVQFLLQVRFTGKKHSQVYVALWGGVSVCLRPEQEDSQDIGKFP